MNDQMINVQNPKYNLEDRTATFAQRVITLCKIIPQNVINNPIVNQLIRSGTSIGANYCEANGASSKKDFKNKIFICKKECIETKYWLKMIQTADHNHTEECKILWQEAHELTLIFSKIASSSQ